MLEIPFAEHLREKRPSAKSLHLRIGSLEEGCTLPSRLSARPSEDLGNEYYRFTINSIQQIKVLGQGSSGSVSLVLHTNSGNLMARKLMTLRSPTDENSTRQELQIIRELKILRSCKNDHIVSFFGAFVHEDQISIMLEYMDLGSLDRILVSHGPIPEAQVSVISSQILRGLNYLHVERNVLHRDLKPGNLLLISSGIVKISDFGISKEQDHDGKNTHVGTAIYMSPETILSIEEATSTADIWSFGLSMMELVTGTFPYNLGSNTFDLLPVVLEEPSPVLSDKYSTEMREFIALCLLKEFYERPSASKLLETKFIINSAEKGNHLLDWIAGWKTE